MSRESLSGRSPYDRLKSHVIAATGLAYFLNHDLDFAEVVDKRLAALGLKSHSDYLRLLLDKPAVSSEWDTLISQLTIGETYFFRHREQFDAIRDTILPEIIARKKSSRQLRIWSAGCATGPEPYSIAILLGRELAGQVNGWDISILGTDINRGFLRHARRATFGDWALRSASEDLLSCFSQTGQDHRLKAQYRAGVSFQYHNLATAKFSPAHQPQGAFDLILCRNVTIYFDKKVTGRILKKFNRSLACGGWLVVGHSECDSPALAAFRCIEVAGATLYQKTAKMSSCLEALHPDASSPAFAAPPLPVLLEELIPEEPSATEISFDDSKLFEEPANDNALAALVCFDRALALAHSNAHAAAADSYRQALYLDRNFILAHFHLGMALKHESRPLQAARSFKNVLRLLAPMEDVQKLLKGGGITVAELRKVTLMHLEAVAA